eukprot:2730706-Rhodomonas_salina.1
MYGALRCPVMTYAYGNSTSQTYAIPSRPLPVSPYATAMRCPVLTVCRIVLPDRSCGGVPWYKSLLYCPTMPGTDMAYPVLTQATKVPTVLWILVLIRHLLRDVRY